MSVCMCVCAWLMDVLFTSVLFTSVLPFTPIIRKIYYWSKWKRRNYSRCNRYQKCCVRTLCGTDRRMDGCFLPKTTIFLVKKHGNKHSEQTLAAGSPTLKLAIVYSWLSSGFGRKKLTNSASFPFFLTWGKCGHIFWRRRRCSVLFPFSERFRRRTVARMFPETLESPQPLSECIRHTYAGMFACVVCMIQCPHYLAKLRMFADCPAYFVLLQGFIYVFWSALHGMRGSTIAKAFNETMTSPHK